MTYIFFAITLFILSIYSWGFVDPNMPFVHVPVMHKLVFMEGALSSVIYVGLLLSLFGWFWYFWRRAATKQLSIRQLCIYLGILVGILFLSFPAFSNDIFNYIATAKVTYQYHENPYIVMPIDIPNEPMLHFLQAANKTALYGPTWILVTYVPYVLGGNNLLVTMYTFKFVAVFFYFALIWLIWRVTKRFTAVVFFAFNPLVIVDTLVDAHNDVVMMSLALAAFYVLQKKKYVWAVVLLCLSILVKGATLFLVPVFVYAWWKQHKKTFDWEYVWTIASYSMFAIFLLSPIREEIYSWYFIWVLTFVSLRKRWDIVTVVALAFTFGLPLRFLPFVYSRSWEGVTPLIKKIVTFVPPVISGLAYKYAHR